MRARIVCIGYKQTIDLIASQKICDSPDVSFAIREGIFDSALDVAREVEARGEADVIMASDAMASLIKPYISTPVVEIKVTGFDLLLAIQELDAASPVVVLTFKEKMPFLSAVENILRPRLIQLTYADVPELDRLLRELRDRGIAQVIGGSLVLERARACGMRAAFIYSRDGVRQAYETAREVAATRRRVLEHSSKLDAIIKFVHDGIVATDPDGVISVFNPSAARITGVAPGKALGRNVGEVLAETRIFPVMKSGEPELGHIQKLHGVDVVSNRIPMRDQNGGSLGCVLTLQDARTIQTAEAKIRRLAGNAFKARIRMDDIVGHGDAMARSRLQAARFARSEASVLIMGETGTGKEYFAQGIHLASARASRPFVGINCAALPRDLLESELFGYAEGAFTGAKRGGRTGLFELAHQGTVFLDEISEMPLDIQGRLLRVLQEREVLRIGDEQVVNVDIRVVAATNRNLWELTQQGLFRQDLYYRLCVLRLHLPPLREHRVDIPALISHFLDRLGVAMPDRDRQLLAGHPWLYRHSWPGNIRELLNFVESVAALHDGSGRFSSILDEVIQATVRDKQPETQPGRPHPAVPAATASERPGDLRRKLGKAELARALGISRTTLWRRSRRQQ